MKRMYYFICSDGTAENVAVHVVPFGKSKRDLSLLQQVQLAASSNSLFYFNIRNMDSSNFVRRLMEECGCRICNSTPKELVKLIKSKLPAADEINLSASYNPLRILRK